VHARDNQRPTTNDVTTQPISISASFTKVKWGAYNRANIFEVVVSWGLLFRRGVKKSRFSTNISLHLGNDIGVRPQLLSAVVNRARRSKLLLTIIVHCAYNCCHLANKDMAWGQSRTRGGPASFRSGGILVIIVVIITSTSLSVVGQHTLSSYASAEICITGWPNAQPHGWD